MLRRWRAMVIDDNPEGSLEAVLLSPLVLAHPLGSDASKEQIRDAVDRNLLNRFLPLADDETYANAADAQFQIYTFDERRKRCGSRFPIIEVERDFARAWNLMLEVAEKPPDIIFLDVMFDQKTSNPADLESIINELEKNDPLGRPGRATIRELLGRGGLFLLGRLLRTQTQIDELPLVVLYTASREVQTDFRPFAYAFDGRFEITEKRYLRTNSEQRKKVFRRRIADYLLNGTVQADEVRAALDLLSTPQAIHGDHDLLVQAFSKPVGSGWVFGTLFVGEAVAYLSSEPERRHEVVADLDEFLSPMTSAARSFAALMESSPARLFSHHGRVGFSRRPSWLDPRIKPMSLENGNILLSLKDLNGELSGARAALRQAVSVLPPVLRNTLGTKLADDSGLRSAGSRLDALVRPLAQYNGTWAALLEACRMKMPTTHIGVFLEQAAKDELVVDFSRNEHSTRDFDRKEKLEVLLAPSDAKVKEPLAPLLSAVVNGAIKQARKSDGTPRLYMRYSVTNAPATLQIELRDEKAAFPDLRYYDPHGRGGDLSTALVAAIEWFDVELHSGGVRCRPTTRGSGQFGSSPVTTGTSFVIRIPGYRMEGL